MGDADELDERVARRDLIREGGAIERVADHRRRAPHEPALGARAHQRADGMSAREQLGNQPRADIAGGAGEEDIAGHGLTARPARRRMRRRWAVASCRLPVASGCELSIWQLATGNWQLSLERVAQL